jgi:hypothetical protein
VKSLCETAINSGSYEAKEVFVSIGLKAIDYHHITSNESSSSSSSSSSTSVDSSSFPTVLSKDDAFVQLNGQSKIEVDENGIFISIPTMPTNENKSTRSTLNTGRRGLRIAVSSHMKVVCVQSSSLILSIPVKRKNIENTLTSSSVEGDDDGSTVEKTEGGGGEKEQTTPAAEGEREERKKSKDGNGHEEEKMRQFLSSSILAIPWIYEGHSLSPAAYIAENESKLTLEEREKVLKEAEEDSIIFANTVVCLAEFISSVPEETTEEILICFSCSEKIIRDILGIMIKLNCCFSNDMNRYDRLALSFPWLLDDDEQQQLIDNEGYLTVEGEGSGRESGGGNSQRKGIEEVSLENNELKKRLKTIEEENSLLKRERNELTKQLLETKEEISLLKVKGSTTGGGPPSTSSLENRISTTAVTEDGKIEDNNSSHSEGKSSVFSDGIISISEKSEELKELATKIIELETKLNISMKKEVSTFY